MGHSEIYSTAAWRDLPRNYCAVALLLGPTVGLCSGLIAHHHVDPEDPHSRTVQVCNSHHSKLHAVLRFFADPERGWKRCPHNGAHRYPGAKEACERRLNRHLVDTRE